MPQISGTNIDTATVTGKYIDFLGNPLSGTVSFMPNISRAKSAGSDRVLIARAAVATLDVNGAFTINLPCSNDTDVSPSNGWSYTVTENLTGGGGSTYEIVLSVGQTYDITDF